MGSVRVVNRLGAETSPYLRQHRDNPVDWYAWAPEAFDEARAPRRARAAVGRLLGVSLVPRDGPRVASRTTTVAAEMNRRFVNIKVDREERPDVDAVYMDAVQAMTGRGGWPMTVFLTPDGEPFYGGTYFPKPNFLQLMEAISDAWAQPARGARRRTRPPCARPSRAPPSCARRSTLPGDAHLDQAVQALAASFDAEWGGFGAAPKFPSTMSLDLVLASCLRSGDDACPRDRHDVARRDGVRRDVRPHRRRLRPLLRRPRVARAALREDALRPGAARAGLHPRRDDAPRAAALATGRHRDRRLRAARPAPARRRVLLGRGRRLARTRRARPRGPVPHVDRRRGARRARRRRRRRPRAATASRPPGNFEGRSIPNRLHARGEFARPPAIEDARRRLFEARQQRPRPGSTTRCSPSGTRLMIAALAEAGTLLGRPDWIDAAVAAGDFLRLELRRPDGRWFRSWHADGEPAGSPRRPRRRSRGARRRLHPARRGDRRGAMDRRGNARSPTCCSTTSGTSTTAGCSPHPTTASSSSPGRRTSSTTPRRRPTRLAAVALYRLAALTGEARYANHADRILQLVGAVVEQAPTRLLQRPRRRRPARRRHHRGRRRRRPTRPRRGRQRALAARRRRWPGASRTTHRCGRAVTTAWPTSVATTRARRRRTTAEGLRAQLV